MKIGQWSFTIVFFLDAYCVFASHFCNLNKIRKMIEKFRQQKKKKKNSRKLLSHFCQYGCNFKNPSEPINRFMNIILQFFSNYFYDEFCNFIFHAKHTHTHASTKSNCENYCIYCDKFSYHLLIKIKSYEKFCLLLSLHPIRSKQFHFLFILEMERKISCWWKETERKKRTIIKSKHECNFYLDNYVFVLTGKKYQQHGFFFVYGNLNYE